MSAQNINISYSSPTQLILLRFLRHRAAVASVLVLVALGLVALAAPLVEAFLNVDSNEVDLL
ncbi:MAG: hypothetical protein QF726_08200, partial [Alphaproteobacteria bacterium]|nr:hypothetical protein [Alphaproteobacteria bacterium]